jgi:class 3 adenylate cyclase
MKSGVGQTDARSLVSPVLGVILTLVPLLVIHAGVRLLERWRNQRQQAELENQARLLIQVLRDEWRFPRQLEKQGQALREGLRRITPGSPTSRNQCLHLRDRILRPPFPAGDVWVFHRKDPASDELSPLLHPAEVNEGFRAFRLIAEHLLHRRLGKQISDRERRRAEQLMTRLFGPGIPFDALIHQLNGSSVQVIFRRTFHHFFWQPLTFADASDGILLLLIPDSPAVHRAAFEMACRSVKAIAPQALTGFIRLHRHAVGDVLPPRLNRSRLFQRWRRRVLHPRRTAQIEYNGPPWNLPLGKFLTFVGGVTDSSHLALAMLPHPVAEKARWPSFLLLAGTLFWGAVFFQGILRGHWFAIRLNARFYATFSLATVLPVVLAALSTAAYWQEQRATMEARRRAELEEALGQIDQARDRMTVRYHQAFTRAITQSEFLAQLRSYGVRAPQLLELFVGQFSRETPALPILCASLFDPWGGAVATQSSDVDQSLLDEFLRFYRISLVSSLHFRVPTAASSKALSTEDSLVASAYHQISGTLITQNIENRRNVPETIKAGRLHTTKLHEFLRVEGVESIAVFVAWRSDILDTVALEHAGESVLREYPEAHVLIDHRTDSSSKEYDFPKDAPSVTPRIRQALQTMVAQASRTRLPKTRVAFLPDPWIISARPSSQIDGTSLAMALPLVHDHAELRKRGALLVSFLGASLLLAWGLGRLTAGRILPSLQAIRSGLDQVAAGNLDQQLHLPRVDEIGQVTLAFDQMIDGLRHRQRLATLVSHEALSALRQANATGQWGTVRRLEGIVLVSDIRQFTTLCERHAPDVITRLLNDHFALMSSLITAEGGQIDKFIGDAVQAVFPIQDRDRWEVIRAVLRASMRIIDGVAELRRQRQRRGEIPYRIGIGLAMGSIIMGAFGDPATLFDFSVLGTTVKRAGHLEGLSRGLSELPLVVGTEIVQALPDWDSLFCRLGESADQAATVRDPLNVRTMILGESV